MLTSEMGEDITPKWDLYQYRGLYRILSYGTLWPYLKRIHTIIKGQAKIEKGQSTRLHATEKANGKKKKITPDQEISHKSYSLWLSFLTPIHQLPKYLINHQEISRLYYHFPLFSITSKLHYRQNVSPIDLQQCERGMFCDMSTPQTKRGEVLQHFYTSPNNFIWSFVHDFLIRSRDDGVW